MTTITIDGPLQAGTYTVTPSGVVPPVVPPVTPPVVPPAGTIPIPWGTAFHWDGLMLCEEVKIFSFVAGSSGSMRFAISEYNGERITRQVMLSRVPGSFYYVDAIAQAQGGDATLNYNAQQLTAGQTYYINVRNYSTDLGAISCTPGMAYGTQVNVQPT